jgi:hypothetical protein
MGSLHGYWDQLQQHRKRYEQLQWNCNLNRTWRILSSGMLLHLALVRTEVLEERSASIIRLTRISELGTTLTVTSNWCMLRSNTMSPWWWRCYVPPKHWFLQEPYGAAFQKMAFFMVTAVKTANLTYVELGYKKKKLCWSNFQYAERQTHKCFKALIRVSSLCKYRWSFIHAGCVVIAVAR